MPFSIVTAGTSLQIIYTDGSIATVTLPTGTTVSSGTRSRFAILGRNVVVVHAVSKPVWVDPDGVAWPLRIPQPVTPPTLAAGAAGSLSGAFTAKVAFLIKDELGNVLAHGPYGPASSSVTVSSQDINYTAIPVSPEAAVNCRRIARTAASGTSYFHCFDIDNNTTTSFSDGASDESLSLLPIETELGSAPPRLTLIVEWKGRLWGVDAGDIDAVVFSAQGALAQWPVAYTLPVLPEGRDRFGITGLIARRDELAIARRDIIWKVVGRDENDFRMIKLVEGKGVYGPDTIVVTRDVGRFLADDGVYAWDNEGVVCISDDDVKPWFTTDEYFNRSRFPNAVARYNPLRHAYDLFLSAAGSTNLDRWVSYDIARKKWLGPHKTTAFTPTCAGFVYDSNELITPVVGGSDGYLYKVTPGTFLDGTATAIDFDVTTAFYANKEPDLTHLWGQLSMLSKKNAAGTLTITPYVGGLDASAGTAISHSLATGRERLRRLGVGRLLKLRFQNAEASQETELYGFELPVVTIGRR